MPQLTIKMFFMDNQDWPPVGQQVPVAHDLVIKSGLDVTVTQGIVIEVKDAPADVKLGGGGDVEG